MARSRHFDWNLDCSKSRPGEAKAGLGQKQANRERSIAIVCQPGLASETLQESGKGRTTRPSFLRVAVDVPVQALHWLLHLQQEARHQ